MGTARVLARGWWRARRSWWVATVVLLIVIQTLVLSVAAIFHGMELETEARISDFFTDDVRITVNHPGAASTDYWIGDALDAALAELGPAMPRLESQFVLSRRGLVEAYLQEQEQFEVRAPGAEPGGSDFYGIGILAGMPMEDEGAQRLRPYLVSGRMPRADNDTVELLMGVRNLADYLDPQERERMGWPPNEAEMSSLRFEITTARIDPRSDIKDLIRYPARVVGLYDTRLDVIDTFALAADTHAVQLLLGLDPQVPAANAMTLRADDVNRAALDAAVAAHGWSVEGPDAFAQRYLGQLVSVLRALSLGMSALFLVLPLFLVWHGMAQMLQMHHREYAVCRAIGVPVAAIGQALARLSTAVVVVGAIGTAVTILLLMAGLQEYLATNRSLPIPLRFAPDWRVAAVLLVTVSGMVAISIGAALRRHLRNDLSTALRAS